MDDIAVIQGPEIGTQVGGEKFISDDSGGSLLQDSGGSFEDLVSREQGMQEEAIVEDVDVANVDLLSVGKERYRLNLKIEEEVPQSEVLTDLVNVIQGPEAVIDIAVAAISAPVGEGENSGGSVVLEKKPQVAGVQGVLDGLNKGSGVQGKEEVGMEHAQVKGGQQEVESKLIENEVGLEKMPLGLSKTDMNQKKQKIELKEEVKVGLDRSSVRFVSKEGNAQLSDSGSGGQQKFEEELNQKSLPEMEQSLLDKIADEDVLQDLGLKKDLLGDFSSQLTQSSKIEEVLGAESINAMESMNLGKPSAASEFKIPMNSKQFGTTVMKELENLPKIEGSWTKISLKLPNNREVELRLQVHNGNIRARFNPDSPELQESLSNGWNQLVIDAAKRGIVISPPEFEERTKNEKDSNRLNRSGNTAKGKRGSLDYAVDTHQGFRGKREHSDAEENINYFA